MWVRMWIGGRGECGCECMCGSGYGCVCVVGVTGVVCVVSVKVWCEYECG